MKIAIQKLKIDRAEWLFFFDDEHFPTIASDDKKYSCPWQLINDYPSFLLRENLDRSAQLINFLLHGTQYQYIDSIEGFKQDYQRSIDTAEFDSHVAGQLINYGQYDLSDMRLPWLESDRLSFYVKHSYTSVPYRIAVLFPYAFHQVNVSYSLLPYA